MYDAFDVFLSFSFSEISKMRACSGKHFSYLRLRSPNASPQTLIYWSHYSLCSSGDWSFEMPLQCRLYNRFLRPSDVRAFVP